jgi:hypothetical protein
LISKSDIFGDYETLKLENVWELVILKLDDDSSKEFLCERKKLVDDFLERF